LFQVNAIIPLVVEAESGGAVILTLTVGSASSPDAVTIAEVILHIFAPTTIPLTGRKPQNRPRRVQEILQLDLACLQHFRQNRGLKRLTAVYREIRGWLRGCL
jgi:hypothetical protein